MEVYRNSKFFTSGSLLTIFSYGLLAIFAIGYRTTSLNGLRYELLIYLLILVGFGGIGLGAYRLSLDTKEPWNRGKQFSYFLFGGLIMIFLAQIFLIISGTDAEVDVTIPVLFNIGNSFMIISCLVFVIAFFILRKQLLELYLKEIVIKEPNLFIIFAFLAQGVMYVFYFVSYYFPDIFAFAIVAFIFAGIFLLCLILGFIQINIIFRVYPHLVEDETLRQK
ncbi:MAG: hypothetical protein ACXABK_01515 [Candidatus Heimdallarchaeaceae archaeon]|jgi:hypothetical protein